ncbi:MAG TPA: recombinase family protein [Ktedonosporobacter sp.]|nr:recombinase family protein [Ktedonosporobacter sp.]
MAALKNQLEVKNMAENRKNRKKQYTLEELYNPQIDLTRDASLYGRQSSKDQVIQNVQSHISQTIMLLDYARDLGFRDDGTTGTVTLFVENEVADKDGNITIKRASGTWPIDRRPGLKTICDLIETGKVGVVIIEFVDRLFRDEDRIDSNIFIKVCREHDCFVHVSSKRMTYNFANEQHAEMFRLEIQMAAMYIKNHVKGTMLRRRDMVVKLGQWGGIGAIPAGYIICTDEDSPYYGKFIPYEPHAKVILWIFIRFIELGYDFRALCLEVREMPFVFPPFQPGIPIIRFTLTPTARGYLVSEDALRYILTNEVYIGNFRRQIQDGEVYREKNHPAIVPEEIFWSAYDRLRDFRPDGTPTGRVKQVRYNQERTLDDRQPLLKAVSEDGGVYWHGAFKKWGYRIIRREQMGLAEEHVLFIYADVLETVVVKRLFEKLYTLDLNNLNQQRAARKVAINKKLKELKREIETINEDVAALTENLKKIKTDAVIQEVEAQIARSVARRTKAEADEARYKRALQQDTLGTLEEELEDLEELWDFKPFPERKALLGLLIESLSIKFLSAHFYSVEIRWNYDNWGVEQAIFYRGNAGSKDWTEEELTLLAELYPQATQLEAMRALPVRTWATIRTKAHQVKVERTVKLTETHSCYLTWTDMQYLREQTVTLADFQEYQYKLKRKEEDEPILIVVKRTGWC